jgi:FkbM family methyltransferase
LRSLHRAATRRAAPHPAAVDTPIRRRYADAMEQAESLSKFVTTDVRGVSMRLVAFTRSLELCARMNYETEVLDFIDCIERGAVLFDLGACEGRFAVYAALKGVECHAFEPETANFQALLENAALNRGDAGNLLHPHNLAIGARRHEATLNIGQPWAGGHHKVISTAPARADLAFEAVAEQQVTVASLDEMIDAGELPSPQYLKVDVDGSELPFLAGAKQTLASPALKAMIFELCESDDSYGDIVNVLAGAGLKLRSRHQVPNEPHLFNVVFRREG